MEPLAGAFVHAASDRQYQIVPRAQGYAMRRWQIEAGQEINVLEESIDYVIGSGHHARTFLHRTENGRLAQLPVSWYAEKGGTLAMSPGYDSPAHPDFRRKIAGDCFACHNAYPAGQQGADGMFPATLPEGIDCQRCHGPGQAHIAAAQAARPIAELRAAIVNPKRLPAERQMEVCLQCHLETTSFELPNSLLRDGQNAFSYRPGQPLGDHILLFDHAPGTGHDDKFEIASAAYRLRKSRCFVQSAGKLQCTTCHNPHDVPRGPAAVSYYAATCKSCHATIAAKAHPTNQNCAQCHMPKRRTEDVVHVVMTDHFIQRRPPSHDLLAMRPERHEKVGYRGQVVLYYPPNASVSDHSLGMAQVAQESNLASGITQLEKAGKPAQLNLAAAYATSGQLEKALALYRQIEPKTVSVLRGLGSTLLRTGDAAGALAPLQQALAQQPDAETQHELGRANYMLKRLPEAIQAVDQAAKLDPDLTEARDSLGNMLAESGDLARAEQELREAIRRQPDFASAHGNLGKLLTAKGALAEGDRAFRKAVALAPANAMVRYSYGVVLAQAGRFADAEVQVQAAVAAAPDFAEAQETLGSLHARRGDWASAAASYRQALRAKPQFGRAHLGLGTALAATRNLTGARAELQLALNDADPAVRQEAEELLRAIP